MASKDSFVVKVKYDSTLRRITLSKSSLPSFDDLQRRVREMFQLPEGQALLLKYVDSDGDEVYMGNDQDFHDAVVFQALDPLRLDVTVVATVATSQPAKAEEVATELAVPAEIPDPPPAKAQEVATELPVPAEIPDSPPAADAAAAAAGPEVEEPKSAPAAAGSHDTETEAKSAKSTAEEQAEKSAKLQREMAEAIRAMLIGAAEDVPAMLEHFEPFLRGAPAKLAEVVELAMKSGLDASFEPIIEQATFAAKQAHDAAAAASAATGKPEAGKQESKPEAEKVIHRGVQCDSCGMSPIVGVRFKSIVKADYDLCHACWTTQGVEGEYNKIEKPLFRPRHPFWGQARPGMYGHQGMYGYPRYGPGPQFGPGPSGPGPFFGGRPFHMGRGGGCHRPMDARSQDGKLDARFVKDVSIFDGTEVTPKSSFTKIWRLRNSGSLPWPQFTKLVFVGGDQLGASEDAVLQLPESGLAPGEEVEVSVDLEAPDQPGRYVSHWRLLAPGGPKFGHRVWALIQVVRTGEPSPQVAESVVAASSSSSSGTEEAVTEPAPEEEVLQPKQIPVVFADAPTEVVVQNSSQSTTADSKVEVGVDVSPPAEPEKSNFPVATAPVAPNPPPVEDTSVGEFALPDPPTFEDTSVGGFAFVEHPSAQPAKQSTGPAPMAAKEVVAEELPTKLENPVDKYQQELMHGVTQLQSMGFADVQLNKDILESHGLDIQKSLDELVAAGDLDNMMEELEEMGFNDRDVNRRLMFKNKGSVRHVVRDLVKMYREAGGMAV